MAFLAKTGGLRQEGWSWMQSLTDSVRKVKVFTLYNCGLSANNEKHDA